MLDFEFFFFSHFLFRAILATISSSTWGARWEGKFDACMIGRKPYPGSDRLGTYPECGCGLVKPYVIVQSRLRKYGRGAFSDPITPPVDTGARPNLILNFGKEL